jgi:hypothetical protein
MFQNIKMFLIHVSVVFALLGETASLAGGVPVCQKVCHGADAANIQCVASVDDGMPITCLEYENP